MTHIEITRFTLYPVPGRRGAPRPSYNYTVDGGPLCQYGPGLASLRSVLKRKYPDAEIVQTWDEPAAAATAAEPAPADWPAPGDRVAVCHGHPMTATVERVERLTPTMIVLADDAGRFYRQRNYLRSGGGGYLRPLDDVEVSAALARAALERLAAGAETIRRDAIADAEGYGPDSVPGRRVRLGSAEAAQLYRGALLRILGAAQAAVYALDAAAGEDQPS